MTSRSEMCTVKYAGVAMTIPESMSNKPGMNGRPPRHALNRSAAISAAPFHGYTHVLC